MPYNLIPIIAIIVCILLILYIVIRKFPKLSMIDVSTFAEERDAQTKEKIIQERMERQFRGVFRRLLPAVRVLTNGIDGVFKRLYQKVVSLERKYQRHHSAKEGTQESIDFEIKQQTLLEEANVLLGESKYSEAEEKLIAVITADPKNIQAYNTLFQLYTQQKEYNQAREAGEFIVTQNITEKEKAEMYFHLAENDEKAGDLNSAHEFVTKAVELESNNPRYLDFLLQMSIMLEHKDSALEAFDKLHASNPDNKKINEYREKVEKLVVKVGA